MDKVSALFEGIGMLSTAYCLGYPVAWVGEKIRGAADKLSSKSRSWQEFNLLYDEMYGAPLPKLKLPWHK